LEPDEEATTVTPPPPMQSPYAQPAAPAAGATITGRPTAEERESSDSISAALETAAEMLVEPTLQTELDRPGVAMARHAAEQLRTLVLEDEDAAYQARIEPRMIEKAVQSEVSRRRTRHRFENLMQMSQKARETLITAWKKEPDRPLRDATKDLENDMLVLGLFNPMTMREIDLTEFVSVARLRNSERRLGIVASEIARRVLEQVPAELHQFVMTRAFVDRVADAAAETHEAKAAMVQVLEKRLEESLEVVLAEVMRRHGIWLPDLKARITTKLGRTIDTLVRLVLK
jgi:hypothetical protein